MALFLTMASPIHVQQFRNCFYQLSEHYSWACLLDSCEQVSETAGYYLMAFDAEETLWHEEGKLLLNNQEVTNNFNTDFLNTLFNSKQITSIAYSYFKKGWLGALAYSSNSLFEPKVTSKNKTGLDFIFFKPKHVVSYHAPTQQLEVISNDPRFKDLVNNYLFNDVSIKSFVFNSQPSVSCLTTEKEFENQVKRILEHILNGDIYQANLSLKFVLKATPKNDYKIIYDHLVNKNPSPFSGLLLTPLVNIISNSPERLIKYQSKNNLLETQPIAGTRSRGTSPQDALKNKEDLLSNTKEQAEHLMLVDLMRNDLGRVSQPNSVKVPKAFFVENYSHVMHLVSQVTSEKSESIGAWDILEATFPGGTITGCPKIRCMQILDEVETVSRGFYTGSLGYVDTETGNLDFNILIRSLYDSPEGELCFHAGAGIVADSVASWEYKESYKKAQAILSTLNMLTQQQPEKVL